SVIAAGPICRDTTGSGFIPGGYWPKGTIDRYVFGSGLQVAGIIGGARTENPWAGDTTGAFFFNTGGPQNGEQAQPIYNSTDHRDAANWPAAALVPDEPNEADNLFNPLLRGHVAASEGDLWWVFWDGDPLLNGLRRHPLGLVVEERGLAWNTPSGNQDILYFTYTLYNITSTRVADYVGVRPAMRDILLAKAHEFQERNNAQFGVTLPVNGYDVVNAYVAIAADMDVGSNAGRNYASANIPFALGYTYEHDFPQVEDWTFDPTIFAPPFFVGAGVVGVKYLKSPRDSLGRELGLTVYSTYMNSPEDPQDAIQLYRYLAGRPDPAFGDAPCNTGDPAITHLCSINRGPPSDMRSFQATGPLTLKPGQSQSIVVAYIFAAPVAAAGCPLGCDVTPGDPTILGDADSMAGGVNPIDSVTGYQGFTDRNGDGRVDQSEFSTVPGSLLGKAQIAQTLFDNGFLLASSAPDAPDFFLIPGSNQVSVIWKPSGTEATGDLSFGLVSQPTLPDGTPNLQYDPNFRRFDVEGYRIYRGRVDTPSELQLVAQFDYPNTSFTDWRGQVNPTPECAPELGITTGCRVPFDSVTAGVAPTVSDSWPLVGPVVQVRLAPEGRQRLATGRALLLQPDTAVSGSGSACVGARPTSIAECTLRDTGVPFAFVDRGVRNDLRYFYTVTAFDVNSLQSGPSSLESPRRTKTATPSSRASNLERSTAMRLTLRGRGVELDTSARVPTLDPASGRFDGPFPPAGASSFSLGDLADLLLPGTGAGTVSVMLDSIRLGSAYEHGPDTPGEPTIFALTAESPVDTVTLRIPVIQDQQAETRQGTGYVDALPVDPDASRPFDGGAGFQLRGRLQLELPGNFYTGGWGGGCAAAAPGFAGSGSSGCEYNGARWFDGPSPARNETVDHPQASHPPNSSTP
ncbi:MAG: hypothetical protein ABI661_12075, partial [Gammaproteobacteria bacterium]